MKTDISDTPALNAGTYIGECLHAHAHYAILCMVSGGSALAVLDMIPDTVLGAHITVCTTDERFTHSDQGNNFLLLQQTEFYKKASGIGVNFIDTSILQEETHLEFCERIRLLLEDYYKQNAQCYTIGLFGIGEDGHTASIFPSSESEFLTTYAQDTLYVQVTRDALLYPHRTTVTPVFIEDKIDDVVLFAVGSNKCDNILNYMHNKSFAHHQIPALIPAQHPRSILFTDCATLL